jgi:hypothetical protein
MVKCYGSAEFFGLTRSTQHPYRFAHAENGGVDPVYDSSNYEIPVRRLSRLFPHAPGGVAVGLGKGGDRRTTGYLDRAASVGDKVFALILLLGGLQL